MDGDDASAACSRSLTDIRHSALSVRSLNHFAWNVRRFHRGENSMKLFSGFIFSVCICSAANAEILIKSPDGTISTKASLAAAALDPDVAGKTVVVTSALPASLSNISSGAVHAWPSDRKLVFEKGGSIANTTEFTINGPFEAGLHQVFAGTGTIAFGRGTIKEAYPEWWGAKVDEVSNGFDSGPAIRKAVSAVGVPKVVFSPGTYKIGVIAPESANARLVDVVITGYGFRLQKGIILTSSTFYTSLQPAWDKGHLRTTLEFTGTGANTVGIYLDSANVRVEGFDIQAGSGYGIKGWGAFDDILNNTITGAYGVHVTYSLSTRIERNHIYAARGGIIIDRGTTFELFRNYVSGNGRVAGSKGVKIGDPTTSTPGGDTTVASGNILDNIIEAYDYGIYLDPAHGTLSGGFSAKQWLSQQIVLRGNYFEAIGSNYLYTIDANFAAKDNITLTATGTTNKYNVTWVKVTYPYQYVQIDDAIHIDTKNGLYIGTVSGTPGAAAKGQILIQPDRGIVPKVRILSGGLSGDTRKAELELGNADPAGSTPTGWKLRYDRAVGGGALNFIPYSANTERASVLGMFPDYGALINQIVPTAKLPAGGASMNGRILIEDGSGDDKNLIFYVGDKRYRIDGGAPF